MRGTEGRGNRRSGKIGKCVRDGIRKSGEREVGYRSGEANGREWIAERRIVQFWKEWAAVIGGVGIGDCGGNVVDVLLTRSAKGI